ncbi:pro-melanin-concentrating hormone, like [Brachionichthys hirsutus]|uniref:pro-melanin-concentrating hormone, like n=1 Tax=Brachionichthys hirsutus TaxID=412623 RepID=UPI003605015F
MRQSLMPIVFTAALLLACHGPSAALPMGNTEDSSLEQDAVTSMMSEELTDSILSDADLSTAGKARGKKVIVVGNLSLWRNLRALNDGLSFLKRRADDHTKAIEKISAEQDLSVPILRRDTMRCMVGRVYRPCWEV